jgi:hypothetical protein
MDSYCKYANILKSCGGTRWRSWLTHCATIGKVAVSIPDDVNENFH